MPAGRLVPGVVSVVPQGRLTPIKDCQQVTKGDCRSPLTGFSQPLPITVSL